MLMIAMLKDAHSLLNAMLKIPSGMDVFVIASSDLLSVCILNLFVPVTSWHALRQYKSSSLITVSVQVDGFNAHMEPLLLMQARTVWSVTAAAFPKQTAKPAVKGSVVISKIPFSWWP